MYCKLDCHNYICMACLTDAVYSYLAYDQTACCQGYFGGYKDKSSDSILSATSQFSEVFVSMDNLLFFHSFFEKRAKVVKVVN